MTLKAKLVAKVVTSTGSRNFKIGTAYPIRKNVVITAFHVIPDINSFQATTIEWGEKESPVISILYSDKDNDIVVLECETPEGIPVVDVCRYAPLSTEHWDSFGFPDAGIDHLLEVRKKTPAGGNYLVQSDESCEMHLEVGSDAAETQLWRGMSGAPVFTAGTNQLTGVICRVPDNENPDFKNRIYATSISQLLKTDPLFQSAIATNNEHDQYIGKQQLALEKELAELKDGSDAFYQALAKEFGQDSSVKPGVLCQSMLDAHAKLATQSIENLRLASEPFMKNMRERCELLLLHLLATKAPNDIWSGDSFHDLSVRTRMLCELKLSTRYQVTPRLTQIGKGEIAGLHAIHDHSSKEVGFDPEKNAQEQAKSIAYHIYMRADDEYGIDEMEQEDWQAVNESLSTRRKGEHPELIRFELNAQKESEHPLASEEVRSELYKLLPALPIVLFGSQTEEGEKSLRAQVKVFYERLEQLG